MKHFHLILLAIGTGFAVPVAAQDSPDLSKIFIEDVSYAGTGCPAGSASINVSPDREAMTVLYDSYSVQTEDVAGKKAEKRCKLNVKMHVPPNWSFAVFGVEYRGFAALAPNVSGFQTSHYGFLDRYTKLPTVKLVGPYNDDYVQSTDAPLEALKFSACGPQSQVLTLESAVRIEGKAPFQFGAANNQGLMTIDSVDGEVDEQYNLVWKACQGPSVTMRCNQIGIKRNGVQKTFVGVATAKSDVVAKRRALAKAADRCRSAQNRVGRMICKPVPSSCEVLSRNP